MRRARRPPRRRRRAGARSDPNARDRTPRRAPRRDVISRHRANDAAYSASSSFASSDDSDNPAPPDRRANFSPRFFASAVATRTSSAAVSARSASRSSAVRRTSASSCSTGSTNPSRSSSRRTSPRRPSTAASSSELAIERKSSSKPSMRRDARGRKKSPVAVREDVGEIVGEMVALFARVGDAGDRRVGRLGVAEWIRLLRVPGLPGLEWVRLDITARVGLRVGGLGLRRGERSRFRRRRIRRIAVILPGIAIGGRRGIIARPGGRVGVVRFFLHSGVRHGCLRVLLGRLGGRVCVRRGRRRRRRVVLVPVRLGPRRGIGRIRDILRRFVPGFRRGRRRRVVPGVFRRRRRRAVLRGLGGRGRIRHAARRSGLTARKAPRRTDLALVPNEAAFECC